MREEEEIKQNEPKDQEVQENETPGGEQQPADEDGVPKLSSFDILVYAYLKEELVNTPCSPEVSHLKQKFPNLLKFVEFIYECLELPYLKLHKSDQNKLNNLVADQAEIRKIKKEKLNQFYEYKDLFCKQQQAFGILPVP